MAVSVTIDSLNTYTNAHFVPQIKDNFFLSSALLMHIKKKGYKRIDGGDQHVFPISHSKSSAVGRWAGRFANLTRQFQEHATQGVLDPVQYSASITLAKTDMAKNKGKAKLVDMLAAQAELAEQSLRDTMGTDLYLDSSSASPKGLTGLTKIINYNDTYAGITRPATPTLKSASTGNEFFIGNRIDADGNATTNFWKHAVTMDNDPTLTTAKMQSGFSVCTVRPELIVTTQQLYNKYNDLLTATQRALSDEETGNAGFDNLVFNTNVPVVPDDLIDDGSGSDAQKMYFLNFKHLRLEVFEDMDFEASDFNQLPDQAALAKDILWMGQMICDRPNSLSVIFDLSDV